MKAKTLSQIRREAGAKGNAVIQARANKDPLITMKIRTSSHKALQDIADARGVPMTQALHDIIQGSSTGSIRSTGSASTGR